MTSAKVWQFTLLGAVAAVGAFAVGWYAPQNSAPSATVRTAEAPRFVHPGAVLDAAARRLEVADEPNAVASTTDGADVQIAEAPKPKPLDIADRLRRDLIAVVVEDGRAVALVRADDGAVRRLRAGATFRNGWRVAHVAPSEIKLSRRGEARLVAVMGAAPRRDDGPATLTMAAAQEESPARRTLTRSQARTVTP